ncbi:MAG: aminotransferase class III-fold pyridoxal phosphate-dependent enzyme, partial [Candidatus Heimdallarchaeota archaeon]|nr:aminotransferase class III-fold pyridoxal phosphate-dependent enzyme [Candidatus Heimdallarchaeota archaeon]
MDPTLEKKSSAYITKDKEYYLQGSPRIQLVIEKGSGAVLTDLEGKEYIDCFAGIAVTNAGHAPKRLMEAAKLQFESFGNIHTDLTAWIAGYRSDRAVRDKFGSS